MMDRVGQARNAQLTGRRNLVAGLSTTFERQGILGHHGKVEIAQRLAKMFDSPQVSAEKAAQILLGIHTKYLPMNILVEGINPKYLRTLDMFSRVLSAMTDVEKAARILLHPDLREVAHGLFYKQSCAK
jgi:hypothetical protein